MELIGLVSFIAFFFYSRGKAASKDNTSDLKKRKHSLKLLNPECRPDNVIKVLYIFYISAERQQSV